MRRILFTVLASVAMLAVGSASALAKSHHRHHHRGRHHHVRVHHEHFGSTSTSTSTSNSSGSSAQQPTPAPASQDTAGTVGSFTNGILTIKLTNGSLVSGMVTSATEIECSMAEQHGTMQTNVRSDGGGDHGRGDNSGDDNDGEHHNGNDGGQQNCVSTALQAGATVGEAELGISSAGAIWDKVGLVPAQMAGVDS